MKVIRVGARAAEMVAVAVVAVLVVDRAAIEMTTEIAAHARIGIVAAGGATDNRTMAAEIGISVADADRVEVRGAAAAGRAMIAHRAETNSSSSRAARCVHRCYRSPQIQKV